MIETITIDTEQWAVVPRAKLSEALDVIQGAMQAAYDNAYLECCGRSVGGECCGDPDAAWSKEDHRVMEALGPSQRALSDILAAAPRPEAGRQAQPAAEVIGYMSQRNIDWLKHEGHNASSIRNRPGIEGSIPVYLGKPVLRAVPT